jgi:hypothetical protein
VEFHTTTATNDSGTGITIHSVKGHEPDFSCDAWPDRLVCGTNQERRARAARFDSLKMGVATEPIFLGVFPQLDPDQSHVEPCALIRYKHERTGNMD